MAKGMLLDMNRSFDGEFLKSDFIVSRQSQGLLS